MMKRIHILTAFLITAGVLLAGCGGGSGNSGCLKNPWLPGCSGGTATSASISGRVLVPGSLSLSREAGRDAALTSTQALSNASVSLYTMGTDGSLTAVSGITAGTTDSSGNFTISGAVAGTHYVMKAMRTISGTTYFVYGVVSVSTSQYGTTVPAGDVNTETTFAVSALTQIVDDYNTGLSSGNQKALSAFSTTDVTSLIGLVNTYLQAQVTAANVSLTNVHTSASTLSTQFSNLQTNVAAINTLVTAMSTPSTDTTAPTVSSFSPASGATGVAYDSTVFKVIFSEAMDTTVNLNTQATLTASGFSITLQRVSTGGNLTINTTNALSYGSFAWTTTTTTNDTLSFTLKTNTQLTAGGLKTLQPSATYNITTRTVPTNLKDAAGNALSTTGIASTGSFTTSGETTAPTVSSFSPASGATNVSVNSPVFKVIFSEAMLTSVNLNTQATLTASGFSITLQRVDTGGSITINTTNALSYGSFAWTTTTTTNDTLSFTLKTNAQLTAAGLKVLLPGKVYNITTRTVPTNLKDAAGNALSATGIASTGSFTTSTDSTAPTVSSLSPANGESGVVYDGTTFSVKFSETMDGTVNLNNQTTLTASGFSISLQRADTGGTLTINTTNALSYGSFTWMSTTVLTDTLAFQLKSSATLTGLGLKTLAAYKTYNITSYTAPSNVTDYSGNVASTSGQPTTGSFTTRP